MKTSDKLQTAFTLAEVLITIAIIGVVAAITLPSLISNIRNKIYANQRDIIEKKFVDGLNLFNSQDNGLSGMTHSSTTDFLEGLAKHYKIIKICDNTNIYECFPYKKIGYIMFGGEEAYTNIQSIAHPNDIRLSDEFFDPAAFVSANGTPFIVSLKKNCIQDPDKPMQNIQDTECVAGFYDLNGARKPNKIGATYDIRSFNGANLGIFYELNGIKLTEAAFKPKPITKAQCLEEVKKNYGITTCSYDDDYWAGAMKHCHDTGGHMASAQEVVDAIAGLYTNSSGQNPTLTADGNSFPDYNLNEDLAYNLGFRARNGMKLHGASHQAVFWSSEQPRNNGLCSNEVGLNNITKTTGNFGNRYRNAAYLTNICVDGSAIQE